MIAALVFVAIAILIAVFFPSSEMSPPTSATQVASNGTSTTPAAITATRLIYIPPTPMGTPYVPRNATPTPLNSYPGPETVPTSAQGYPLPTAVATGPIFGTPASRITPNPNATRMAPGPQGETPFPTFGLPTFAPSRGTVGPSDVTAVAGGEQSPGYPAPGGLSVTPTEPLFNIPTITPLGANPQNPGNPPNQGGPQGPGGPPTAEPEATEPPEPPGPSGPPTEEIPRPTRTPRPTRVPQVRPTATPTAIPIDILRGNVHWSSANGPILLKRDQQLAAGATLTIEAGTTILLAPGVSFYVEGTLYGVGEADRPIQIMGSETSRWEGIFGQSGSNIALVHTDISGGGAGGTVITSENGNLELKGVRVHDNGGRIAVSGSRLEIRDSEVTANDLPYGAAVEATYENGGFVIMGNNRIGGNRMSGGAPPVQINNQSSTDIVNIDIEGNLLVGQDGPDLVLFQDGPYLGGQDITLPDKGPFLGTMSCNALMAGSDGLSIRSNTNQIGTLNVSIHNNAIENHSPPIVPVYTQPYNGIGRGATSEIAVDMSNNWWGNSSGPYEPDRHATGRGDAVGDTVSFTPWLTARPACAPSP